MHPAPVSSRRKGLSLVASLGVISTTGMNLGPTAMAPRATRVLSPESTGATGALPDDQLRDMVLGRWRMEAHGTRVVDNRPDGTASMDVTFDFVASLLYGPKLALELRWSIENGALTYTIHSGAPQPSFDRMTATYGRQATYEIKSIDKTRMHLVRVDVPDQSHLWTRVD
jgi:hypothetical protein